MENQEVWVAGEALIDLVTRAEHVTPIVGGGPANTAKALSRSGVKTSFIGGISSWKTNHRRVVSQRCGG